MSNTNKRISDIQCETCSHSDVCAFKETYLSILDVISNGMCVDDKKSQFKKVVDFDFISKISVICRYYCCDRLVRPVNDEWKISTCDPVTLGGGLDGSKNYESTETP